MCTPTSASQWLAQVPPWSPGLTSGHLYVQMVLHTPTFHGARSTTSRSSQAAAAMQLLPGGPLLTPVAVSLSAGPAAAAADVVVLTTKACRGVMLPVRSLQLAASRPVSVCVEVTRPSLQGVPIGKRSSTTTRDRLWGMIVRQARV